MVALKKASEGSDPAAITTALEQLNTAQHKAAETLYTKTAAEAGASGDGGARAGDAGADGSSESASAGSGSGGADGDVIDAEVVEDEKK